MRCVYVRIQVVNEHQGVQRPVHPIADLQVQVGEAGSALAAEGDDLAPAHGCRLGQNMVAEIPLAADGSHAADDRLDVVAKSFQVTIQGVVAVRVLQAQETSIAAIGNGDALDRAVGNGQNREAGALERTHVDAGVEVGGAELLERRADTVADGQRPAVLPLRLPRR